MGMTAENLAEQYDISAEDCNKFAHRSQARWKAGQEAGAFDGEMAPIEVKVKKGKVRVICIYFWAISMNLSSLHIVGEKVQDYNRQV